MMDPNDLPKIEPLLTQILDAMARIEERKLLYEELDRLVLELRETGFTSAEWEGLELTLRDNFADGNVCFRPAAVRRYELTAKPIGGRTRKKV